MGYYLILFYSTAIVYQISLMFIYFKPFFLDWSSKRKQSWNPYYDRFFTTIFLSLFVISILFVICIIYSNNKLDNSYLIYFYTFMIISTTTIFTLIFFNKEKLQKRKTKEEIKNELEQQNDILETNQKKINKRLEKQIKIENITKHLKDIKQIRLEEISILHNQDKKNKLDVEIITKDLKEIIQVSSEEIIEKIGYKKLAKETKVSSDYSSSFTPNQLSYLWGNLRKYGIIDDNYSENDFCKSFLVTPLIINMETTSLYYFHKEINKLLDEKIIQSNFITFFRDEFNNPFNHGTFRNAVRTPEHKLITSFKDIFNNFPK